MTPRRNLLIKCLGLAATTAAGGCGFLKKDDVSKLLFNSPESKALDESGIPNRCKGYSCDLTKENLKKIRFKGLGGEATSITDFERGQKIILTVEEGNPKKYIFSNSGKAIKIKKDSKSISLRANGTTEFIGETNELRKGDYGLPRECINNKSCSIAPEDLEEMEFKGFESEAGEVSVTPFEEAQTIALRIEEPNAKSSRKKYIFNNNHSNSITISKGNLSITLDGTSDSVFVEESGKLKKVELGDYGLPQSCGEVAGTSPTTCTLEEDDLKKIHFKNFDGEGSGESVAVSNFPDEKITLTIEEIPGTSKRKFIFSNESASQIVIQKGSSNVTLRANGKTRFVGESNKLKEIIPGEFGIPSRCSTECILSADDLEQVKFKELGKSGGKITVTPSDKTIKLKIDSTIPDNRKYIFLNESGSNVVIKEGDDVKVTLKTGKTKFTEEGKELKELTLDQYGIHANCNSSKECKLTADDLEDIKFQALDGGSGKVTVNDYPKDKNITLKILGEDSNRRYIFLNESNSDVTISKTSSNSSITLKTGKTKFTLESNKLKLLEIGDFGVPKECETNKTCQLEEDDLKDIKFKGLTEQNGVTISNLSSGTKITLNIVGENSNRRYIFKNESGNDVEIKEGEEVKVTLKNGKTKFTIDSEKLKPLEIGSYGVPKECETNANKTCELIDDDLKDINFKDLDGESGEATVSNLTSPKKIKLKIDESDVSNKRYIFFNDFDNDIEIKKASSSTVTLKKKGKTKFTIDSEKLEKQDSNDYGLPKDCESECKLTIDDLDEIRFEDLGEDSDGEIKVSPDNLSGQIVTLKIEDSGDGQDSQRKYIFTNSSGKDITIKRGEDVNKSVTIKSSGSTKFTEDSDNKKLKKPELSNLGIPSKCTADKECTLTSTDLEDIKFKDLGEDAEGLVTVSNFPTSPGEKITLKIEKIPGTADDKKYIFSNGSSSGVEIKRGEDKKVTLGSGKTRFTEEDDKLSTAELDEYGLPNRCKSSSDGNCQLTQDDLEQVKFDGFEDGKDSTVANFPSSPGNVTLKIDQTNRRYIFRNSGDQSIEIKGGNDKTVTLKTGEKTRFKGEDKKLKKIEVNELGISTTCVGQCDLTEDDLEDIKFKALENGSGEVKVSDYPADPNKKIKLKIDSTDSNNNKYIFFNDSEKDVVIKKGDEPGANSVTLKKGEKTKFSKEGNQLKQLNLGQFNLPENCTEGSSCNLSSDDLEDVKFSALKDASGKVTVEDYPPSINVTLKIIKDSSGNKKRYIFSNSSNQDIKIKRGGETITLGKQGKTRFEEDGENLKKLELGNYGLPQDCISSSSCQLIDDDLELVKFSALGDEGAVTVTGLTGDQKITLQILDANSRKKYIFTNSNGTDVEIKRGSNDSNKVTIKNNGEKTKFSGNDDKLIPLDLGEYGLPKECRVGNSCTLIEDDLEDIKFKDLGDESEGKVTVDPKPSQNITLEIEDNYGSGKKYIFNNSGSGEIKIKRGNTNEVTLKTQKTRFIEEQGKLKILELTSGSFGLPSHCTTSSPCTLTADDLEHVKFKDLGEESDGSVTVTPTNQSITLNIEEDQQNKKKYIFSNSGNEEVKIKRGENKEVTIKVGERARFSEDGNDLKKLELGEYGLPENCSNECTLTQDDLEQVKFEEFSDGQDSTVKNFPSGQTISLKVITDNSSNKRYVFSNDSSQNIEISRGSASTITLGANGKTRFTGEQGKLKKLETSDYGLPKECSASSSCTLIEDDLEQVKFSGLGDGNGKVTITDFPSSPNSLTLKIDSSDPSNKKYIFTNTSSSEIKISRDGQSVSLNTKKTKFIEDKGKLKAQELMDNGLPKRCEMSTNSSCTLTQDDLEDIKFEALKDGSGEVKVENYPSGKTITLTIITDGSNTKRYVFNNESDSEIKITKGSLSVSLVSSGKTRFNEESKKLKKVELGSLGLPKECTSKCELVQDDLEQIKFDGFNDNGDATVTGLDSGKKISLNILTDGSNKKRYVFSNGSSSEVKIEKNGQSVILKNGEKGRFTEESSKLKKLETNDYGLPKECDSNSQCTLNSDDLERIKFSEFEGGGDAKVSGLSNGQKVTLKIVTDGSSKKRYIFTNSSSSEIKISKGSSSVSLGTKVKARYGEDGSNNKLKKITKGSYGLPTECNTECSLIQDDLEQIKFEGFNDKEDWNVTGFPSGSNQTIKLKIETISGSTKKKYSFDNTSNSSPINIQQGSTTITLEASKKTKFIVENEKLKKMDVESTGIPKECLTKKSCSLKTEDLEEINFEDLGSGEDKVTVSPTNPSVNLKIEDHYEDRENRKKYIFTSDGSEDVKISKGTKEVTFKKGEKTRFLGEGGKLKKWEYWSGKGGLPKICEKTEGDSEDKKCKLSKDDVEHIKFNALNGDGMGTVTKGLAEGKTMEVRITGSSSGSWEYKFYNNSGGEVKITKGQKKVTFESVESLIIYQLDRDKFKKNG